MRGERVEGGYTGTAAQILSKGGMAIKFMAVTGSSDTFEEEQLGGKNLGVSYNIRSDEIILAIKPCYYASRNHCSDETREIVTLDSKDIADLTTGSRGFSRRNALSSVHGNGSLRPPRSRVSCSASWEDSAEASLHWGDYNGMGPGYCDLRKGAVGTVVHGVAQAYRSAISKDDSSKGCQRDSPGWSGSAMLRKRHCAQPFTLYGQSRTDRLPQDS